MSYNDTSWTTDGLTKAGASSSTSKSLTIGALTADTLQLSSNVIKASDGGTTITLDTSDNVTITGDLAISGGNITTALTLDSTLIVTSTTQLNSTLTAGVDGTGYDVKFFGDTASNYMLWDQSADRLKIYTTGSSSSIESLQLIHTDADANKGPGLSLRRISNDALNDILGQVSFGGDDDGGSENTYSSIRGQVGAGAGAMAAGAEEGALNLIAMSNGTSRSGILIKGTASDTIDIDIGYGAASLTKVKGYFAANGATPAAAPDYTVSNKSGTSRSVDANGDIAAIGDNLAQLVDDLIAIGLLQ